MDSIIWIDQNVFVCLGTLLRRKAVYDLRKYLWLLEHIFTCGIAIRELPCSFLIRSTDRTL